MKPAGARTDACLFVDGGRPAILFAIRASQTRQVVTELLGEISAGIVGSDRYPACDLPDGRHQFCWAHLLRDLQALVDRGGALGAVHFPNV